MENEIISLGSNCCICYQLNKYNLRKKAYPFDWVKININQLLNVLENNFNNYYESIEFKKISEFHKLIDDDETILEEDSLILYNYYKIQFAHELNKIDQIEEFRKKICNRVDRFFDIKNSNKSITFIRIELGVINLTWEKNIIKLIELLKKYVENFKLKLVINSQNKFNFPDFVEIYRYENFDPDWKMDNINWKEII